MIPIKKSIENTNNTLSENCLLSDAIFQFCLENATIKQVQSAVKNYRLIQIAYDLKREIGWAFPEIYKENVRKALLFSSAFRNYNTDPIKMGELNREIDSIQRLLKLFGKFHNDYAALCLAHDSLVIEYNKMNEPITEFLKLYKKTQKLKGKKVSVRKKKEDSFYDPFANSVR